MSKVFLCHNIDNNILLKGVLNQGVLLKFASGGKYIGEFPVSFGIGNAVEIDVISFLSSVNGVEVGLNIDSVFVKFVSKKNIYELISLMNGARGVIFFGRRDGRISDVDFSQYIYGFSKGGLNIKQIMGVLD